LKYVDVIDSRTACAVWMLLPGFARIVSFVEAVLDVLADADRQASAAHARYPVAD
jgi:hypothetical protein